MSWLREVVQLLTIYVSRDFIMIKTGRNDPCPCGSGNKYMRCCMDSNAKQRNEFVEELEHKLAMNPDLSLDELNLIAERLANNRNSLAMDDFCGLSPNQIQNWLYAPVANLNGVTVSTPADFSDSPVMLCKQCQCSSSNDDFS